MALVALVCGCLKTNLVNILSNHPLKPAEISLELPMVTQQAVSKSWLQASSGTGGGNAGWIGRPRGVGVTAQCLPMARPHRRHLGLGAHSLGSKGPSPTLWPKAFPCWLLIPNNIRCLLAQGQESFCVFCLLDHPSPCSPVPSRTLLRDVSSLPIRDLRDESWLLGSQMRASLEGLPASLGLNKPPCPPQSSSICFLQGVFLIAPVPMTSYHLSHPLLFCSAFLS